MCDNNNTQVADLAFARCWSLVVVVSMEGLVRHTWQGWTDKRRSKLGRVLLVRKERLLA